MRDANRAIELLEDRIRERLHKYKARIAALERQVETLQEEVDALEEQREQKHKRRRTVVYEDCSSD